MPASTATAVAPTPSPTPDVAGPIRDLIARANEAEIDAYKNLDPAPFECCYVGTQLTAHQNSVASFRTAGRTQDQTLIDLSFRGLPVAVEGGVFVQRTVETWSSVIYQRGTEVSRSPARQIPQNYTVARIDSRWVITGHEFEPVIETLGCPETVTVDQRTVCVPSIDGGSPSNVYGWRTTAAGTAASDPAFATSFSSPGVFDVELRACTQTNYCDTKTTPIRVVAVRDTHPPPDLRSATVREAVRTGCAPGTCVEGSRTLSVTWTLASSAADVVGARVYMGTAAGARCVADALIYQMTYSSALQRSPGAGGFITVTMDQTRESAPRGGSLQQLFRAVPSWWTQPYCVAVAQFNADGESERAAATVQR